MMATQPDMILQFARHLGAVFQTKGYHVGVYAKSYVALNGRPSQVFINPCVNLLSVQTISSCLVPLKMGIQ